MTRAFTYRLYPTKKQEAALEQTLTTCRILYNHALEHRIKEYKEHKKSVFYEDQNSILLKDKDQYDLNVHSQVLQDTLKRLDTSFKNFFRRVKQRKAGKKIKVGFPRFKGRNRYKSFCYPQSGFRLTNDNRRIQLSKIGDVKLKYSRPIEEKIKTCRVIRDVDQWFVILTCEQELPAPPKSINPTVGVDVGIKTFAVLSDGEYFDNPRHLLKSEKKLSRTQRRLSRRVKGSKNRNKQRIEVAKVHRRIRRQRDDFLHKLSKQLVDNYGCIVFENLNIRGMLRNHKLAKHISDCAWNKLIQFTQYKAASAGVEVRLVNPRGTSQRCSGCGEVVPKTLADRVHCCPHCGLTEDRDLNAAKNICVAGAMQYSVGITQINAYGDLTDTQGHSVLGQVESVK
jgi:putative transposase